jgi:hypothetical protein
MLVFSLWGLSALSGCTEPEIDAVEGLVAGTCADGIDNDANGLVDCEETLCQNTLDECAPNRGDSASDSGGAAGDAPSVSGGGDDGEATGGGPSEFGYPNISAEVEGVPWSSQIFTCGSWGDTRTCGPTVAGMVTSYHTGEPLSASLVQRLVEYLGHDWPCGNYSTTSDLARLLDAEGVDYEDETLSADSLAAALGAGKPVIAPVYTQDPGTGEICWTCCSGGPCGHFMVIVGIDGESIIANDPGRSASANGEYKSFDYDDFVLAWSEQTGGNFRGLVVSPPRATGDCVDGDGDGYGEGSDCLGADCDDSDSGTYYGASEAADYVDNDCDGVVDEGWRDELQRLYYSNGYGCTNPSADLDHCMSADGSSCVGGSSQQGPESYSADGKGFSVYKAAIGTGDTVTVGDFTLAAFHSCFHDGVNEHWYGSFDSPSYSSLSSTSGWDCTETPLGYVRTGTPIADSEQVGIRQHYNASPLSDRMYSTDEDEASECDFSDQGVVFYAWE